MRRALVAFVLVLLVVLLVVAHRSHSSSSSASKLTAHRTIGFGQIAFDFAGPERWASRARRARREVRALRLELRATRRELLSRPSVVEAINLAGATYGDAPSLWRVSRCETGGTFSPSAYNHSSGASGLFQFLPSTWASTPYARFSVKSAYASALAAGWMRSHGRAGEWVCK